MKTIRYTEIQGYKIITGFDKLRIDPVATNSKVKSLMEDTSEGKNLISAQGKLASVKPRIKQQSARQLGHDRKEIIPDSQLQADHNRWAKQFGEAQAILAQAKMEFVKLETELKLKNRVYFNPRKNEIIPANQADYLELKDKFKKTGKTEFLTIDGKTIQDNTKIHYWIRINGKFEQKRLEKIGEEFPENSKLELTEDDQQELSEHNENARIENLSDSERAIEIESRINAAAMQAAQLKTIAEIKGDSTEQALIVAQDLFKKESEKIKKSFAKPTKEE